MLFSPLNRARTAFAWLATLPASCWDALVVFAGASEQREGLGPGLLVACWRQIAGVMGEWVL